MTERATPPSGTSELLGAPRLYDLGGTPEIGGVFCYLLRRYRRGGLAAMYRRDRAADRVYVRCGDWDGNTVDVEDGSDLARLAAGYLGRYCRPAVELMAAAGLDQAQFYLTPDMLLTDVQISLNKLVGPGMLRELFGRLHSTPEVLKIETLDRRALEAIDRGTGTYAGDLIAKPSRFRQYQLPGGAWAPLYCQVERS